MKKRITMIFALIMAVGLVQAGTIEYNFDAGNGVANINTLTGVLAGDVQLVSAGGRSVAFQNDRAELNEGRDPDATLVYTIDIPAGVTVDLSTLNFEYGFNETVHPNALTPKWNLSLSTGSGSNTNGGLPATAAVGFTFADETVTLTGMTGLTDTSVTFTFTFDSEEDRSSSTRWHTMDDIVLIGTVIGGSSPPSILSFSADSTSVLSGETVTLSWITDSADTLTLDPGGIDVTGQTSTQVVVTANSTYTLTAVNTVDSDIETVDITLITTAPVINSFDASSTNVFSGETITLSWDVDDATGLSISGIGDVTGSTSTSTQVVVSANTTYTLTATNLNGSTTSDEVTVTLKTMPEINSFTPSQSFVLSGDTVTLSWDVDGASEISIDQGVGDVSGTNQVDVVVTAETMYTLTATSSYGESTNTPVTVSVVELSDSTVISINFDDGTRAIDGPLGAVISTNWNLADFGGAGSPVTTTNLLLSTGAESTADLELSNRTVTLAGGWAANGVVDGAIGNMAKLFHYRNRNHGAIATVSELTFTTYDVYVYFSGAIYAGETFDVSLGGATQTVTSLGDASAFVEANSVNSYTGNYYVFKDVTGSSFTLTVGDDVSSTKYEFAFGMQIVNTGTLSDGPVTVTIAGPVSGGDGMEISWFGKKDALYGVETNSNLIVETDWQQFGDDVIGDAETITVTNTIGPNQTFYRVISK